MSSSSRQLMREEAEMADDEEVAALIGVYAIRYLCKEPCRTSEQTGMSWVQEILHGHDDRCYQMFRMEKSVFDQLCTELAGHGLQATTRMGIHEMVAMFLHIVGHGVGNRNIQERFQHSGETVHRHFHAVLTACLHLSLEYIKPQDPTFRHVHPRIQQKYPFFQHAIGAIDGTHIQCVVPERKRAKFIGRKGFPSQNVMAVCDWDMCFTFVLAGWEGTAHDARIFDNALTTPAMNFPHPPPGKYYLVDAGYPTPVGYLGPYRSERYHLGEFRRSRNLANPNEAFNYQHSSLRSTIERTFGVWKNRFAIIRQMPKFKFVTQVYIVCATMAIHNFIRRHSVTDSEFRNFEDENIVGDDNEDIVGHADINNAGEDLIIPTNVASSRDMSHTRDLIRDQIVQYMADN